MMEDENKQAELAQGSFELDTMTERIIEVDAGIASGGGASAGCWRERWEQVGHGDGA